MKLTICQQALWQRGSVGKGDIAQELEDRWVATNSRAGSVALPVVDGRFGHVQHPGGLALEEPEI